MPYSHKHREIIAPVPIKITLENVSKHLHYQLDKKGCGAFVSTHEALGVISEEFDEFKAAVRSKDVDEIKRELLDLATAVNFTLACLQQGAIEIT